MEVWIPLILSNVEGHERYPESVEPIGEAYRLASLVNRPPMSHSET
jgi:hypothetical protein